MFIQTEATPNPNTLKFIPGEVVMQNGTASFLSADEAKGKSALAEVLFKIGDVSQVFFGSDFITVTKAEPAKWDMLKANILTTIMDHYISGRTVIDDANAANVNTFESYAEGDEQIVREIKELIDTRVRPAVAQDGGDIIFKGFTEGTVYLELHGACSGCPSSTATLKNGIESMLKHYIPEVIDVQAINGEGSKHSHSHHHHDEVGDL
jgi:Fe-S cluster biogenesis protein NfuA